jgi:hypothetical protein
MKSKNSTILIGVIQILTSVFILGWIFSIWSAHLVMSLLLCVCWLLFSDKGCQRISNVMHDILNCGFALSPLEYIRKNATIAYAVCQVGDPHLPEIGARMESIAPMIKTTRS